MKYVMTKWALGASAALALILSAPAAQAQDKGAGEKAGRSIDRGIDRTGEALDRTGDKLERAGDRAGRAMDEAGEDMSSATAEISAGCSRNYKKFDRDGNGKVSKAEFTRVPSAFGEPEQLYSSRDTNQDGSLSQTEFCSGWTTAGVGSSALGSGYGSMHSAMGAKGMGAADCRSKFRVFDQDNNGRITDDEVAGWPRFNTRQGASLSDRGTSAAGAGQGSGQVQLPATESQFCSALQDSDSGSKGSTQGSEGSMDRGSRATDQPGSDRPGSGSDQPGGTGTGDDDSDTPGSGGSRTPGSGSGTPGSGTGSGGTGGGGGR